MVANKFAMQLVVVQLDGEKNALRLTIISAVPVVLVPLPTLSFSHIMIPLPISIAHAACHILVICCMDQLGTDVARGANIICGEECHQIVHVIL